MVGCHILLPISCVLSAVISEAVSYGRYLTSNAVLFASANAFAMVEVFLQTRLRYKQKFCINVRVGVFIKGTLNVLESSVTVRNNKDFI